MNSTATLIKQVKQTNQDFEWYPTTNEILSVIKNHMASDNDNSPSVLDCGAGDGRALEYLTKGNRYAIEKSTPLLQAMDRSTFIVGTEFQEQTLIDKKVDVVFSNPPYSEFSNWAAKIIREANCESIYLILPQRWAEDRDIASAVESRQAETKILGSFDFLNAERKARAKVDIVFIDLAYSRSSYRRSEPRIDPFDLWFDQEFHLKINKEELTEYQQEMDAKKKQQAKLKSELVEGQDIVIVLEKLYQQEMLTLLKNYKALETLNADILLELDVNINGLKKAVKQKVNGLKDRYWNELFNNLDKITSRLTTGARKRMLEKLSKHTHVDFTVSNAYAILIWVIKNANQYFDNQLIDMVERMTEQASVNLYKSNKKTFGDEQWRYNRSPDELDRYSLDYRIVLHRCGGISTSSWDHERREYNNLQQRAFELISDVITVANNLGYDTTESQGPKDFQWLSNKAVDIEYYDAIKGKTATLFTVRAFKNGNLHLKLNQSFIVRLNVEFGRLKGWLKSAEEAATELDVELKDVKSDFGTNVQLGDSSLLKLCFD